MSNRIFLTGDKHGDMSFLQEFCLQNKTDLSDILIILGDAGLRFEGVNRSREIQRKTKESEEPKKPFDFRSAFDEYGNFKQ